MIDAGEQPGSSECWCCGAIQPPANLIHLGNHPEVHLCVRCAYSVKTWASEIEDRGRSGPGVTARAAVRRGRSTVMRRHLHQHKWIGRPLRWLGRRLP
jgi:hypothetical protein